MTQPHVLPPKPPRRAGRAAVYVLAIAAAIVVLFFVLRVVWHSEVVKEDPASLAAPDQSGVPGQAPAE